MKLYLISAFLCLAGLTHGASIQRMTRDTEAIIPTIVEEILKVELQSDLKKNSAVEAFEVEPVVKPIKEEVVVEPVASRTVEDGTIAAEEKKPEIVEIVAVKEVIPEPIPAVRTIEPVPVVEEKVEIVAIENVEKPIDNFRTESVPSVEQPTVAIVKETVVVEPVADLHKEPVAEIVIKEEEIVAPMFRNVVKEEIPQVEELRNIVPVEMTAVKDIVPEPVQAAIIVEPVVEIVPEIKTIAKEVVPAPVVPEVNAVPAPVVPEGQVVPEVKAVPEVPFVKTEVVPEIAPVVAEIKEEKVEAPIVPEFKAEEVMTVAEVKTEDKPVPETVVPIVDETDPQVRQDSPNLIQQVQTAVSNAAANIPIIGQILNRNPAVAATDEVVGDESATTTRPNLLQQAAQAVTNTFTNALNAINPQSSNAATGAETATTGPVLSAVQNFVSGAVQNTQNALTSLNNIINPTTAPAKDEAKPTVADEKPVKADEKPAKADESVKSFEPESIVAVDPVVVQKFVASETQKVVEEEKENLVKNWASISLAF